MSSPGSEVIRPTAGYSLKSSSIVAHNQSINQALLGGESRAALFGPIDLALLAQSSRARSDAEPVRRAAVAHEEPFARAAFFTIIDGAGPLASCALACPRDGPSGPARVLLC